MAISVDPLTDIIYVPKADLTLIQASPEVRELDLDWFRLELLDWEDEEENIYRPKTHTHNTEVTLAGLTYARIIEILDPYTIEFENGTYTINCVGANHNISDKKVANSVSLIVNNAAGLITNSAIEYASFSGGVTLDPNSPYSGTVFPVGTPQRPVNNLTDALLIANVRGFIKIFLNDDFDIDAAYDLDGFSIEGISEDIILTIDTIASVNDLSLSGLTLQDSALDGGVDVVGCIVKDVSYVNGHIHECGLAGRITLGGSRKSIMANCYTVDQDDPPIIDMGGSGNDLAMPNYSGIVTFQNLSGADNELGVGMDAGFVTLDSTISAGTIIVSGIGLLADNSTGTAVINTDGILNADKISQSSWVVNSDTVSIDVTSGNSGVLWPVGNKLNPVNNIADAIAIANNIGANKLHITGTLTLVSGDDVSGFTILADRSLGNAVIVDGAITNKTYFQDVTVSGVMNGSVRYTTCVMGQIDNFDGGAKNCLLTNTINITGNGANYFTDCDTYFTGSNYIEINIGDKLLNIIRCRGGFNFTNYTGSSAVTCDFASAQILIDSTCVSGIIVISGLVNLTDNSGPGCYVVNGGLSVTEIESAIWTGANGLTALSDLSFLKKIEGGKWEIAGGQMIFYDDDNITEVARFDLAYDGEGNPISRTRV